MRYLLIILLLFSCNPIDVDITLKKIYAFFGQSNMVSTGPSVSQWNNVGIDTIDRAYFYEDGWQPLIVNNTYRGPEIQFCHRFTNEFPEDTCWIIKHAVPSTSMCEDWINTEVHVLNQKITDTKDEGIVVKALAYQGESDRFNYDCAVNYTDNFYSVYGDLATNVGYQFPLMVVRVDVVNNPAYIDLVRSQQEVIGDSLGKWLDIDNQATTDGTHRTIGGIRNIGNAFYSYTKVN